MLEYADATAAASPGAESTASSEQIEVPAALSELLKQRFGLPTDYPTDEEVTDDEPTDANTVEEVTPEERRVAGVQAALQWLAARALKQSQQAGVDKELLDLIDETIAQLDRDLSKQLSLIMHHEDFTKLEGSWRGLQHLVDNSETSPELEIRVLNISKEELYRTSKDNQAHNKWDQSPLFRRIYEEEFGMPGGHPFGCLIGDFAFSHEPQDLVVLRYMAKIAAAAHCPFIAAASPRLLDMKSWQSLRDRPALANIFQSDEYNAWRTFRESEDSRFIGLTMPRFLARLPYDPVTNPAEGFAFRETDGGMDHTHYVWCNAAYAMGANIARAHSVHGWCAQIRGLESGGIVEELPMHTFPTDDGGVDTKVPTEIGITDRREGELSSLGLIPLSYFKRSDYAAFISAQSVQIPKKYHDDPDATSNANLSARLPYIFTSCRFAHYLKCFVRDKIGSSFSKQSITTMLNDWIQGYATETPGGDTKRPLRSAHVELQDDPLNPGYYHAQFSLLPHFQLEGMTIALSLVSRLPRDRK